jgi:hypothetical protein
LIHCKTPVEAPAQGRAGQDRYPTDVDLRPYFIVRGAPGQALRGSHRRIVAAGAGSEESREFSVITAGINRMFRAPVVTENSQNNSVGI